MLLRGGGRRHGLGLVVVERQVGVQGVRRGRGVGAAAAVPARVPVQGVRAADGRLPRLPRRQERVHPHRAQLMATVQQVAALRGVSIGLAP